MYLVFLDVLYRKTEIKSMQVLYTWYVRSRAGFTQHQKNKRKEKHTHTQRERDIQNILLPRTEPVVHYLSIIEIILEEGIPGRYDVI